MTADSEKLSAESSPKMMEMKTKRARRINNWPMFLVIILVVIIILTLGMVVVNRSNKAKADISSQASTGKVATAHAKELTSGGGEGGIVGPKEPEKPVVVVVEKPLEPPKQEAPPIVPASPPPGIGPEKPRVTDEVKKIREKRFKQVEAAIDGPIKASIDDVKLKPRNINDEIAAVERQLAALGGDNMSYEQRLAAIQAATGGGSGGTDYSKRGDLSRLNQFGANNGDWTNPSQVEAPSTMCILRTGTVIPATLISGINSDLPGQIVAQVAMDVCDTPIGDKVLIPQGSRLIGEYSSQVQYGQSRVFTVWQRIVFPDGKALDLGAMPGSTGAGYAGFRDRVNNHYIRIFGSAIMMSAILAGVEMTQDNQRDSMNGNQQRMSDALSEALGQQLGGVMAEMLQKNMNIAPTLEIRPGYRMNVMLVKDLVFSGPYQAFDYRNG